MSPERLLSIRTVAERIDASPMTVYRMIYAGKLTGIPIGLGRKRPRLRVAESELENFIRTARTT